MSIKTWAMSFFREIFLYHHNSLEFRAKVIAPMIAACVNETKDCDFSTLQEISKKIYPDDEKRQEVLVRTVKEYVKIILHNQKSEYDNLLKDILGDLKIRKEFTKKINLEHLKLFMKDNLPENQKLLQLRLYEFFENIVNS